MSQIKRFGVSIQEDLVKDFDSLIKKKGYPTRSKAIEDLIREKLKEDALDSGKKGIGAVVLVYDHHRRELVARLTTIQHDFGGVVICTQHVHLDHHNCMEILVVRGRYEMMKKLTDRLKAEKGVKSAALTIAASE